MITEDCTTRIKNATIIQEVIGDFIKLKKSSTNFIGLCPFHDEHTPSFTVSPAKQIYKCFGCGRSGDAIAFLMEHEKLSYVGSLEWLASKYNIQVEEDQKKKDYKKPQPKIEILSEENVRYFEEKRKISKTTLLRFKITQATEWMPKAQAEINTICFNYYRDTELINIKYRAREKDFKMAKDAELIFYNLNDIKFEKTAIITEGEIDCLSLYEAGFCNVVSVPNGAAPGTNQLSYLDNCCEYFHNKEKIILMTDGDKPGDNLRQELARRIGYEKCFQVDYPGGCKDANDVLVKCGAEQLKYVVDHAYQWPIQGLVTMDDMFEAVTEFYETGYPKGVAANIRGFDDLVTFYPGQLTVITGIPGSGKSEFMDWIMASLSKYHKWVWGVCSFETPPEFHVTKIAEKFVGKSFDFRKNQDHRMNKEQFEYAIGMIDKYFHFINLSLVDVTMDGLIAKAEELVSRKGINGLLFDPWNCIEHKYGEESETKYVLTCLNKLIAFLERHRVHGFLVAHPTKLRKDSQTQKYEIPNMYSISGSAHFFNRTHNGISINRDFETNVVDVYVQKVKWSWLGKTGYCSFNYDTFTREYKPVLPELPEGISYYDGNSGRDNDPF